MDTHVVRSKGKLVVDEALNSLVVGNLTSTVVFFKPECLLVNAKKGLIVD